MSAWFAKAMRHSAGASSVNTYEKTKLRPQITDHRKQEFLDNQICVFLDILGFLDILAGLSSGTPASGRRQET